MSDGRRVNIVFTALGDETKITETFDAETHSPIAFQKAGWQAIPDHFGRYAEQH